MCCTKDFSVPSPWVLRFAPLIPETGNVLDLACGRGRHSRFLSDAGYRVTAVDRDISGLPVGASIEAIEADLENGEPWPLAGRVFDGIVVTNYLYRPLFPQLIKSLRKGGVLIYETFAVGHEAFGRPRNPDFLLRDRELLDASASKLSVVAYEAGRIERPLPAIVQRIAAMNSVMTRGVIPPLVSRL